MVLSFRAAGDPSCRLCYNGVKFDDNDPKIEGCDSQYFADDDSATFVGEVLHWTVTDAGDGSVHFTVMGEGPKFTSYGPSSPPENTLAYPFVLQKGVLNGYSSTRVSLWDALMFGRLAMGFANVRAGTRVLMLVLVQVPMAAAAVWRTAPSCAPS